MGDGLTGGDTDVAEVARLLPSGMLMVDFVVAAGLVRTLYSSA